MSGVKVYVVARSFGERRCFDEAAEMYGPPLAAFTDPGDAQEYAGASGLAVTEVTLWPPG